MDKAEAEAKAKAIAEAMGWEDKYYLISAASRWRERSLLGCDDLYHRESGCSGRRGETA